MPPATFNPYTGDFIRLAGTRNGTVFLKSSKGIDGPYYKTLIDTNRHGMMRQPIFLRKRKRILVSCSGRSLIQDSLGTMQSRVFYSDDNGDSWKITYVPVGPRFKPEWPHKKARWQNYAIEPTMTELSDGSLWMLLRTSMDNLYESFSYDYGTSWSVPKPSRFYSTLTMPTLFRLTDGRLLLFSVIQLLYPRKTDRQIQHYVSNKRQAMVGRMYLQIGMQSMQLSLMMTVRHGMALEKSI